MPAERKYSPESQHISRQNPLWRRMILTRQDCERLCRLSGYPGLKKKPSDYMRDMFYSTQPLQVTCMIELESTFRMINAETQLLFASDYPHWDFDVLSKTLNLPFLTERAKHNIMGGSAARLFSLPACNERQAANLAKFAVG